MVLRVEALSLDNLEPALLAVPSAVMDGPVRREGRLLHGRLRGWRTFFCFSYLGQ